MLRNTDKSVDERYEFEKERKFRDDQLTEAINKNYSKMVNDLKQGKVNSSAYREKELFALTDEQLTEVPRESKSFGALWDWKNKLKQTREEAEMRDIKFKALEKITGKEVNIENFEKIEKEIDNPDKMKEYLSNIAKGHQGEEDNTEYQL